jgi:hypothetical protein
LGNNNRNSALLGAIAAVCVVFFWSGWIVVSRIGVTHHLTVYDVTGLRFSIGAAVAMPYIIWRRAWMGDILFLAAIALFAVFMVANRVWTITPGQVVFAVTIVSAVFYIPAWIGMITLTVGILLALGIIGLNQSFAAACE